MTTGVHRHGAAEAPGDPHGPLEAGQACLDAPTGHDRQIGRPTGLHPSVVDLDLGEALAELDHDAVEAGVGHEGVRSPAEDVDRPVGPDRDRQPLELLDVAHLDELGRLATDSQRGPCAEGRRRAHRSRSRSSAGELGQVARTHRQAEVASSQLTASSSASTASSGT